MMMRKGDITDGYFRLEDINRGFLDELEELGGAPVYLFITNRMVKDEALGLGCYIDEEAISQYENDPFGDNIITGKLVHNGKWKNKNVIHSLRDGDALLKENDISKVFLKETFM